jgi:RND superfamily putative drug exporter
MREVIGGENEREPLLLKNTKLKSKKQPFTVRVAKWSAHHPWLAMIGWILFVAMCISVGNVTGTNKSQSKDFWVGEAGRAEAILSSANLIQPSVEKILITSSDEAFNKESALAAAKDISRRMVSVRAVEKVDDPSQSADGKAFMVAVTIKENYKAKDQIQSLQEQTTATQAAYPNLKIMQTGDASISKGNDKELGKGLQRAEMITLPVTLIILFLVFGALLAAGVPLILALSSVAAAMGLYGAATYVFPDAGGAVANVVLMIGLAVGVDYSLFLLKRVREERERAGGQISHAVAAELAAATSGKAILVSGFAVLVSLVGLYVADDVIFSSIATGSIIVVMIAMISSLTVLPALLAKLGRRVDGRRFPLFGRWTTTSKSVPLSSVILKPAMRHPLVTFLFATVVMIIISLPASDLQLKVEGKETFPKSMPAMATYDRLTKEFPAEGVAHLVVVRSDAAHSDEVVSALKNLSQQTHNEPLFTEGKIPKIRISADSRVGTLELPIPFGSSSREAAASLEKLRTRLMPATIGRISSAEYAVTGEVARSVDTVSHQNRKIPLVAGFVLILSFVILLVAFRSVVIALIGIALNALSTLATLGALVMVFQYNWAENLFGLAGGGFVSSRIPLILFVILFGLSMDYQVFVVSRIREAALRGMSTRDAIVQGITSSAVVVTSAAIVMMSVFISFIFVPYLELKEMGFGLAFAVLLDAVIVRILILPSIMTLLGNANWWPSHSVRRAQFKADNQQKLADLIK